MATNILLQKIAQALRASYGPEADIIPLAYALLDRKALVINPNTAQIEIVDAYAVRELAPELLKPARFSPLAAPKWEQPRADADFDEKIEVLARNWQAFGISGMQPTAERVPGFGGATAEEFAAFLAANPSLDGGGK